MAISASANGYNPFNNTQSPEMKTPVNPYQKTGLNDDGNTCQFIAPPTKE